MTPAAKRNQLELALIVLFLVSVFLAALTKVVDSETWLHLSLGRLIWQMKAVPTTELFTYPIAGTTFVYNSWLFGVLCYLLDHSFGAYGLGLLKALTITTAFYILFRDSLRPHRNYAVTAIVLIAVVVMSRYRFVMRPDMFLMVFLSFSIYSLNAYLYDGKKALYALPVVHLLWANMHASVIIMFVPFLSFIFGSILQRRLKEKGFIAGESLSNRQIMVVAVIFVASFLATLIGPHQAMEYLYGPKYITSNWHTHNIMEMLPPTGIDRLKLIIAAAVTALSFVLNRKRLSIIHLFLVIPFIALPFVSIRFQFILAFACGPVVVRNISAYLARRGWGGIFSRKFPLAAAACIVGLACVLNLTNVSPFGDSYDRFGFGYNYAEMPDQAVKYLDKRDIYGRIFNPFRYGQYIIWTGYPERTVFTDARGHLPADLLEDMQNAPYDPGLMDSLQAKYGFEALLLSRPILPPNTPSMHGKFDISFQLPGWALVYWDDKSFVYLKKGGKFAPVITTDEYKLMKPLMPFSDFIRGLTPGNIPEYESELKRAANETTDSSRANMFLSLLYLTKKDYPDSITAASKVKIDALKAISYIAMGDAYKGLGDLKRSLGSYRMALEREEIPGVYYRAGVVCSMMGDPKRALRYYKKALKLDGSMSYVYPELINTYRALGMKDKADEASRKYQRLTGGH